MLSYAFLFSVAVKVKIAVVECLTLSSPTTLIFRVVKIVFEEDVMVGICIASIYIVAFDSFACVLYIGHPYCTLYNNTGSGAA